LAPPSAASLPARHAPPVVPPVARVESSEDLEVLPDDLPALPDLEPAVPPSDAEAEPAELIALDEPGSPAAGNAPAGLEITGGFSQPAPGNEPAKGELEIGGLDGAPDERVPIDSSSEDLFDRNYKDLAASDDISIDLEVEPEKKSK